MAEKAHKLATAGNAFIKHIIPMGAGFDALIVPDAEMIILHHLQQLMHLLGVLVGIADKNIRLAQICAGVDFLLVCC